MEGGYEGRCGAFAREGVLLARKAWVVHGLVTMSISTLVKSGVKMVDSNGVGVAEDP